MIISISVATLRLHEKIPTNQGPRNRWARLTKWHGIPKASPVPKSIAADGINSEVPLRLKFMGG